MAGLDATGQLAVQYALYYSGVMDLQPAIITFRNDAEIASALMALGAGEGNRTAVIKSAIMAYASAKAHQDGSQDAALHDIRQNLDEISRQLGIYLGVAA